MAVDTKKKVLLEDVHDNEGKKRKLQAIVKTLSEEADELYLKAEKRSKLDLLSKANVLRAKVKEKIKKLKKLKSS